MFSQSEVQQAVVEPEARPLGSKIPEKEELEELQSRSQSHHS